jgi:hypothetical protein
MTLEEVYKAIVKAKPSSLNPNLQDQNQHEGKKKSAFKFSFAQK